MVREINLLEKFMLSSRRTPGPIAATFHNKHRWDALRTNHKRPWLWVPAFPGTTRRYYPRTITSIAPLTITSNSRRGTWARARMAMVWMVAEAN